MAGIAFRGTGYVQLPGKPEHVGDIWLTFNANLRLSAKGARHEGFCLRLSAEWTPVREGPPEIGIQLTTEQWLDLIAEMQRKLRQSENLRKQSDRRGKTR
jgi:hypothetical protein